MDPASIQACLRPLLARTEPGPLSATKPWNSDVQRRALALDPGTDAARRCVKASILLWNDDGESCHSIVQDLPDPFGAYLHGVVHRREPDFSNARYWFRRVGDLPLFPQLREAAIGIATGAPDVSPEVRTILGEIERTPKWDPLRMVEWCESARSGDSEDYLRVVQAVELQGLTFHWMDQARIARP